MWPLWSNSCTCDTLENVKRLTSEGELANVGDLQVSGRLL
jgi:hypothetical protein